MQQTVCIGYGTSAWQGELKTDHVTYIRSKQMAAMVSQRNLRVIKVTIVRSSKSTMC